MTTTQCKLATTESPFGGTATVVQWLSPAVIAHMYRKKCGVDVLPSFGGAKDIGLYECSRTGYRFWRPACVAGSEDFYHSLSHSWHNYYRTERWEYPATRDRIRRGMRVLEIGCGRGYFLKSLEATGARCEGLELNSQAIDGKVTNSPIHLATIEDFANAKTGSFDVVCSFQVLEHIVDPYSFLKAAAACIPPGGMLAISTPNRQYCPHEHQEDAFDLPPHHMGHFDASTFRRIAPLVGLSQPEIRIQPRTFTPEPVSDVTHGTWAFKLAGAGAKMMLNLAYRATREPGPNLLALYTKIG